MSGTASAIRMEHVSMVYPGTDMAAIDDVSLEIEPGQLVVLLGPSGSGKTTLLKMVNRLIEPTSGTIYVDGQPINAISAPALRRRIGYVIQQVGLFPHMRVEENIAVVPKLLKWGKQRTSERVDELLDLVGMPPEQFRRRYPSQLSGGQQQRVGLARALAADPPTLLMDEPFGALDAITRTRLQDELLDIQRRLKRTILFVTHDIEEAVKLADRIVVMRDGRVVQYADPLTIVLEPADEFVAELVGAGDVQRRLSLMSVSMVSQPLNGRSVPDWPAIEGRMSLRDALNQILAHGVSELAVVDDDGNTVGTLQLADILRASVVETQSALEDTGAETA